MFAGSPRPTLLSFPDHVRIDLGKMASRGLRETVNFGYNVAFTPVAIAVPEA